MLLFNTLIQLTYTHTNFIKQIYLKCVINMHKEKIITIINFQVI